MRVQGQATLFVKVNKVSVKQIDVLVSDDIGSDELLLSWQNLITLRVLRPDFPSPMPEEEAVKCNKVTGPAQEDGLNVKMEALHHEFEDVFSDRLMPGKRIDMAPVDIQLVDGAKPKAFYHCKQYPLHMSEEA